MRPHPPSPDPLAALGRRRLLVVTGKGGVGKSTVAAGLGRLLAGRGRRTLVLEVDPRESVHRLLGLPPSGGEIVAAGGGLHLQNLRPRQVLDQIIRERVRLGALARKVLRSPVYEQIAEGMPGLREVAVIRHSLTLTEGADGGFDTVILDAPATGHGVSLLAAPGLVAGVISTGPVGRMAAELAAFVADPERCGVVVVTLAEEMPVDEALELGELLDRRLGRPAELLVVNGLYPPLGAEDRGAGTGGDGGATPAMRLWRERRRINEAELARLAAGWPGPRAELPLLAVEPGPALVDAVAERLAQDPDGREAAWT